MISEPSASHHSVMFCTLYVVLEAGYFLHQHISYHGKPGKTQTHGSNTIEEWKRELVSRSAKGALMVDKWVNDWFEVLFKESANGNIKEFKRGNVEEFLSERVFGLDLKQVLADPIKHHVLAGLVSELECRRSRRFPSGFNGNLRSSPQSQHRRNPYRPLFFIAMGMLYSIFGLAPTRTKSNPSIIRHFDTATSLAVAPNEAYTGIDVKPHLNSTIRAIPASSLAMVSSLSNLSSIGLCTAPPLRTRQRSRIVDAVIAMAQIPASSLAMMSSLSSLSSIGMCAAPPLRTRQRSRTTTSSVVGYASAVPFAFSQKITAAA